MGPCAKQTVRCTLFFPSGRVVEGTNACESPQAKCPRLPGEDYTKCVTVCGQQGHAEVQALRAAGDASGAHAVISGHYYACESCASAMRKAGVRSFLVVIP